MNQQQQYLYNKKYNSIYIVTQMTKVGEIFPPQHKNCEIAEYKFKHKIPAFHLIKRKTFGASYFKGGYEWKIYVEDFGLSYGVFLGLQRRLAKHENSDDSESSSSDSDEETKEVEVDAEYQLSCGNNMLAGRSTFTQGGYIAGTNDFIQKCQCAYWIYDTKVIEVRLRLFLNEPHWGVAEALHSLATAALQQETLSIVHTMKVTWDIKDWLSYSWRRGELIFSPPLLHPHQPCSLWRISIGFCSMKLSARTSSVSEEQKRLAGAAGRHTGSVGLTLYKTSPGLHRIQAQLKVILPSARSMFIGIRRTYEVGETWGEWELFDFLASNEEDHLRTVWEISIFS